MHTPIERREIQVKNSITRAELIEIAPAKLGQKQRFVVWWRGEVLLAARDPEHEACRALLAKGITGTLRVRWKGAAHDASVLDIEIGAGRTTRENDKQSPRIGPWTPFWREEPGEEREAA